MNETRSTKRTCLCVSIVASFSRRSVDGPPFNLRPDLLQAALLADPLVNVVTNSNLKFVKLSNSLLRFRTFRVDQQAVC
jgi:hypothetical protein